ncbi:MAG: hypothetical protein PHH24_00880 [Candidatus Moranbacteria bacterium]|nr:hypothetical protein [Candidatus Moranbacteria bacterium]MDD5652263.1 hypothetical protein [Candidatus Moranbacteria bacterium]MDX9855811.1 hypothetical protein [Candidatus Moranbacteria bacterium]
MRQFIKNPLLSLIFGISILINLINFTALFLFLRRLNNVIILHYNVYLGVDIFGHRRQALFMPFVGFFFILVNLILAYYFFSQKERLISHVLSLTTLIIQLGLTVAGASIIMVNYL